MVASTENLLAALMAQSKENQMVASTVSRLVASMAASKVVQMG